MMEQAKYTVVGGQNKGAFEAHDFAATLRVAGRLARSIRDSYGTMLDWVEVRRNFRIDISKVVLAYWRDTSGDGTRWFRAKV